MPYKSSAQRAFFHTATAKKSGITGAMVEDYDKASKGMTLPERMAPHEQAHYRQHVMKQMRRHGR